jgi:tetratricopeptide (TPR) repeat protein
MSHAALSVAASAAVARAATAPAARRAAPAPARGSVVAKVGRSGVNKFTGEPEWVEISDAAAAIEDAQAQYEAKDFTAAVKTLEGALKMSGSGVRRDRAKPAELSLGEQQAVFYNLMCAHSQLGDVDKAIASLEAVLRAGYFSAQLYGFGKANEDYERLMRDGDLEAARADPRFKQVVDRYNVEPSELQLQLDPSQSVIGRAMKMWGSKK